MARPSLRQRVFVKADSVLELATKRNLSIAEIARRCGYSPTYFSRLLNGEREAGEVLRNRLMDVLGLIPGREEDFDRIFFIHRNNQMLEEHKVISV